MFKRIREIDQRMTEIRSELLGSGEVNVDALNTEIETLTQERSALVRRMEIANRAADGMTLPPELRSMAGAGGVHPAAGTQGNTGAAEQTRSAGFVEPAEYRDAWAATMLGLELTEAQRRAFNTTNAEYRAFNHTTENTAVLIPETVVAGIWKRAEEAYPLWADVRKFSVPGTLTMKRFDGIKAGDAAWYDEETEVADEQNAFGEISLTGCELAKSVTVSWKLRAMAISEFIPFIEREIGERMGVALGHATYTGKGKPGSGETFKAEPNGIKTFLEAEAGTPQVKTYTSGSLTDTDLRAAIAKLHSSHIPQAAIYVNNATAWTVLAGVKDGNEKPIFVSDQITQGAVGRMFGMPVKVDAAIADGEILIGHAFGGYWANVNKAMTMHTEEHVKARTTDYMGYAIVDGDVYDSKAFALLKPGT